MARVEASAAALILASEQVSASELTLRTLLAEAAAAKTLGTVVQFRYSVRRAWDHSRWRHNDEADLGVGREGAGEDKYDRAPKDTRLTSARVRSGRGRAASVGLALQIGARARLAVRGWVLAAPTRMNFAQGESKLFELVRIIQRPASAGDAVEGATVP